jgi:hypothetical protein
VISARSDGDPATELLIRARAFIERGWCQHVGARDVAGSFVSATDQRAVAWCMYGALMAAGMPFNEADPRPYEHPAAQHLRAAIDDEDICVFNNAQETIEPVLAAFDRAIRSASPIAQESADLEPIR